MKKAFLLMLALSTLATAQQKVSPEQEKAFKKLVQQMNEPPTTVKVKAGDMLKVVRNNTLPVTALLSDVSRDLAQALLDSSVRNKKITVVTTRDALQKNPYFKTLMQYGIKVGYIPKLQAKDSMLYLDPERIYVNALTSTPQLITGNISPYTASFKLIFKYTKFVN